MKKKWIILIIVLLILIGIRIALPSIVKRVVNNKLSDLEGYDAGIKDVDMNLYRGAYEIDSLNIVKTGDSIPVPFVYIKEIDISLQWKALFRGKIVTEVVFLEPDVNFAVSEAPGEKEVKQDGSGVSWVDNFKELLPVQVNKIQIIDGEISYKDFKSEPKVDINVKNLQLLFTNLSNVEKKQEKLPSRLKGSGNIFNQGLFSVDAKLNVLREIPDMDLNLEIENVPLTDLNDFLRAYANVDAEGGTFNLYSEIIVDDGNIGGYVKPLLENIEIIQWKKEKEEFIRKVWEGIVGGITEIFENQPKDQFATQVPLEGKVEDVDTGIFPAVWNVFKNAFIEAFNKGLSDSVGFDSSLD